MVAGSNPLHSFDSLFYHSSLFLRTTKQHRNIRYLFSFSFKNYPQKTLESPLNFSELLPVKNPQSPLMNIPLKACEKPLHSLQETLCLHLNPLRFPFKKPLISPWETFDFPLKGIFQREFKGILLGKIPLEFPLKGVSRVILRGNIVILKGFLRNTCKIYSRNT